MKTHGIQSGWSSYNAARNIVSDPRGIANSQETDRSIAEKAVDLRNDDPGVNQQQHRRYRFLTIVPDSKLFNIIKSIFFKHHAIAMKSVIDYMN